MKKNKKILIFLIAMLAILIVSTIILLIVINEATIHPVGTVEPNARTGYRGVIVKVNEDSLGFMTEAGEPFYLIYKEELGALSELEQTKVKLKEGQHVIVAYSGHILNAEPKIIPDIGGIFVVKEKSDMKVPDNIYDLFKDYYTVKF